MLKTGDKVYFCYKNRHISSNDRYKRYNIIKLPTVNKPANATITCCHSLTDDLFTKAMERFTTRWTKYHSQNDLYNKFIVEYNEIWNLIKSSSSDAIVYCCHFDESEEFGSDYLYSLCWLCKDHNEALCGAPGHDSGHYIQYACRMMGIYNPVEKPVRTHDFKPGERGHFKLNDDYSSLKMSAIRPETPSKLSNATVICKHSVTKEFLNTSLHYLLYRYDTWYDKDRIDLVKKEFIEYSTGWIGKTVYCCCLDYSDEYGDKEKIKANDAQVLIKSCWICPHHESYENINGYMKDRIFLAIAEW